MTQHTTRIGVVSDTHCPEFLDRLPDSLFRALDGVDLIIHAGDVGGEETLKELGRIAPVEAVRGDHDHALSSQPLTREVEVEGKRVVVVHGNRSPWIEEPQTLLWTLSLGRYQPHPGLPAWLRARYPDADAIVFGHTHRPYIEIRQGKLLFNPGGVHQWNPQTTAERLSRHPGWFEWCWLQVARHIRSYPKPTVGILEARGDSMIPKVIDL